MYGSHSRQKSNFFAKHRQYTLYALCETRQFAKYIWSTLAILTYAFKPLYQILITRTYQILSTLIYHGINNIVFDPTYEPAKAIAALDFLTFITTQTGKEYCFFRRAYFHPAWGQPV